MNNKTNQDEMHNKRVFNTDLVKGSTDTEHVAYIVGGHSLSKFGIGDGDFVIVKLSQTIDEDRISVWETPEGPLIKFAYENFGDIVLYTNLDQQERYKRKKVKMVGPIVVVQKAVKPINRFKSEQTNQDDEAPSNIVSTDDAPINAVCSQCKKEMTGTSRFLKLMGWKLNGKETLCLNCDLKD